MPLAVSTLLGEHAAGGAPRVCRVAWLCAPPSCGAFAPALPGQRGEAAGLAQLSEQDAKLKARQRAWTGHIKEVSGAARATRPSSSSPLAQRCLCPWLPWKEAPDKRGRAFWAEITLSFFFCGSPKLGIKYKQKC